MLLYNIYLPASAMHVAATNILRKFTPKKCSFTKYFTKCTHRAEGRPAIISEFLENSIERRIP